MHQQNERLRCAWISFLHKTQNYIKFGLLHTKCTKIDFPWASTRELFLELLKYRGTARFNQIINDYTAKKSSTVQC